MILNMIKKLHFLGTAAFIPTKERDNAALLYSGGNGDTILIDCPGSIVQKLMRLEIDYKAIKNIVISHAHPDHIYGLCSFIHCFYNISGELNIYSSQITQKTIKDMLSLHKLDRESFPQVNYITLSHNKSFNIGPDIKIKAFKNKHSIDSLGIRISEGDTDIVYSSDTAILDEIREQISQNTVLIHECTSHSEYFEKYPKMHENHCSSRGLAVFLSSLAIKPKAIYPIHFLLENDQDLEKMKKELEEIENIYWADDMNYIEF